MSSEHTATARADGTDVQRRLRTITRVTARTGGPLFALGVILHPARDGESIAAIGDVYGITHTVQAIGLLIVAFSLATAYALSHDRVGTRGLTAFLAAMLGTLLWFALIVLDGSGNPLLARYAPELVHTSTDFDPVGAIIALPALLAFPLGNLLLARVLARHESAAPGLLIGAGALVYTIGGLLIFPLGPHSPLVQILEVTGAVPYGLGFVLLGHGWR
jgi:hypothetical protein